MKQITVSRLAKYFEVTPPTATVIIRRLEDQDLIKKTTDAIDGRLQHISLTKKGHRLLAVQEGAFQALAKDIGHILTKKELHQYSILTQKICKVFENNENHT